ncbi:MAG TPA: LysR family transcriptional regulator [Candidatus Blautia pullistercoris]|uniref:LysR family transcriptional regulator n=1 Tax=Candidatus Blautia pullistercoris TaxID=2838499 RepID=A0A9D2ANA2_9FIRM|nr:LysR family transcriptional regulator [Candidatus Blautia pullistercoris]
MDIRQLRYFTAIVEEGTLTGAARRLNMTQPPLTAQLRLLEEELKCPLFTRDGKRLHLTEAGHHFYERAQRILGMCDAAVTEMADFQEGAMGTLRIGVISSVKDQLFPRWICCFWKKYPNIRYEIYSANTYQLLEQLQNGQIDLALVRTPFSKTQMDILYIKKEPFLAIGHSSFFPCHKESALTVKDLENTPLILYRRWEEMLKMRFETEGISPRILCCNDDAQTTLALASLGMGVGLLPASGAPESLPSQASLEIELRFLKEKNLYSQIALVCRKKSQLPNSARLFWEMIEGWKSSGYH